MAEHKTSQERVAQIVSAALKIAEREGYQNVTRKQIADAAGLSEGSVSFHLGTMPQLRRHIVRHAIAQRSLRVLGQALAAGDSHARKAPDDLKKQALAALA